MSYFISLTVSLLIVLAPTAQGAEPTLQIVSPPSGTVARPGQTLSVDVLPSVGSTDERIMVLGQDPLRSQTLVSPPYHFSIDIPPTTSPGPYTLTAIATIKGGKPFSSARIVIDVERPDSPERIRVRPEVMSLLVGGQEELLVTGTYKDAGEVDISKSTRLSFESESPAIASVAKGGKVTGVSAGSTGILINREVVTKAVVVGVGRR